MPPPPPSNEKGTIASVLHSSPKHVPLLTSRKITPQVLTNWEHACRVYFKEKDVANAKKVAKVTGGLQDELVRDWYFNDADTLDALSWANFLKEMRKRWLPKGWVDRTLTDLLRSRQRDDEPFEDWVISIEKLNTLLRGTTAHLDNTHLRTQICAAACEELRILCDEDTLKDVEDYRDWKNAVIASDVKHLRDRLRILKLLGTKGKPTGGSTAASSASGQPGEKGDRPPRLTKDEKELLRKYSGCFTCRKFFVDHQSKTCPNGYPKGAGYRTLTMSNVNSTKAKSDGKENQKPRVAAVTDDNTASDGEAEVVAAVVNGSPLAATSGILGTGSDSDNSEYVLASVSVPHIPWSAVIHLLGVGYSDPLPMLINSGSTTVLIRESLVASLNLRRWKLPHPKAMGSAWADKEEVATEFVKLHVSSPNFAWSSVTCHAIIVPSLCSPVILGRPFLKSSHLVVDHNCDTIVDKRTEQNILDTTPPAPCPDVYQFTTDGSISAVLAVRERVEELARRDALLAENDAVKLKFANLFPDNIPDLVRLPDDIFHRFVLKDPHNPVKNPRLDGPSDGEFCPSGTRRPTSADGRKVSV
ncbi:hypothetical protein B0H21DRAFT_698417 [Amylocystis lapponica]|nr:hypothetical protein B0H21DRAFT_698417 [Amylocystis lapponica]